MAATSNFEPTSDVIKSISMTTPADSGPKLLLDWQEKPSARRILRDGAASIAINVLLLLAMTFLASIETGTLPEAAQVAVRRFTPLIAPTQLTQKEPNKTKPAKEVKLENLLPEPERRAHVPTPPAPPPRQFQPPAPPISAPPTPKPVVAPEPPKLEASTRPPQVLSPSPILQAPPPQIQPEEKPKIVLETPGGQNGSAPVKGGVKIPMPKTSVDDALRSAVAGGGASGMVVGDIGEMASMGDPLRQAPMRSKTASTLELLSDPMGVDFKPYLIRVLAAVRRNWFAVIPESARMGRRGKVVLQFSVDRDGGVPKLVIAMPSGAEPLDRAAVAGISASVPLPPLPKEFTGNQIKLQLAFAYNMQ